MRRPSNEGFITDLRYELLFESTFTGVGLSRKLLVIRLRTLTPIFFWVAQLNVM